MNDERPTDPLSLSSPVRRVSSLALSHVVPATPRPCARARTRACRDSEKSRSVSAGKIRGQTRRVIIVRQLDCAPDNVSIRRRGVEGNLSLSFSARATTKTHAASRQSSRPALASAFFLRAPPPRRQKNVEHKLSAVPPCPRAALPGRSMPGRESPMVVYSFFSFFKKNDVFIGYV